MELSAAQWKELDLVYLSALQEARFVAKRLLESIPAMLRGATDPQLIRALRFRLEQTKTHIQLLQSLIQKRSIVSGDQPAGTVDEFMAEAPETISESTEPLVRDLLLLGILQRIEHGELARYGTLRQWAELLDLHEDRFVLDAIEEQEEDLERLHAELSDSISVNVFSHASLGNAAAG